MYAELQKALSDLVDGLPRGALEVMAEHWNLIQQWNMGTNLTSIRSNREAAWLHYRDSLEGLSYLMEGPVVDIGSGAGFPGIPLAVARPDWAFTLVESRRKRASFLIWVSAALGLNNISVCQGRSQDRAQPRYAHAVTRATLSHAQDLQEATAWLKPNGTLMAYRGSPSLASYPSFQLKHHSYPLYGRSRCIEVWEKIGEKSIQNLSGCDGWKV